MYKTYGRRNEYTMVRLAERYAFSFDEETENGLEYTIEGEIWFDNKDKRYKYNFSITAPMDVFIEKENTKGFINIKECLDEINEYKVDENELLRLIQANS